MIRGAQFREAKQRYREMAPVLNEQSRRRFAALEAGTLGHGGVSAMARISGLARSTIYRGLLDIRDKACAPAGRIHTAWNRLPYSRRLVGGLGGLDEVTKPNLGIT
jgi:hypothetical protein